MGDVYDRREGTLRVILFGGTGMVGQGVLRECVLDAEISEVLLVSRSSVGERAAKVREVVHRDFFNFEDIAEELKGYEACLFCLGVSSAGMKELEYTRLTYDLTMAAAEAVLRANRECRFLYVSGAMTDGTERDGSMWARVKGRTENALMRMPFGGSSYMFRPGYIQPMHGIRSKTRLYRALYAVIGPMYPLLRAVAPKYVATTEEVGLAMVAVAKRGDGKRVLENVNILRLAAAGRAQGTVTGEGV